MTPEQKQVNKVKNLDELCAVLNSIVEKIGFDLLEERVDLGDLKVFSKKEPPHFPYIFMG